MTKTSVGPETRDSDLQKGTVESGQPETSAAGSSSESMAGQLGHRDPDELIKENDSDFPEPGATPEHSGQRP